LPGSTAFGDKKQLFGEAVRLVPLRGPETVPSMTKTSLTARGAAEQLLRSVAVGFTGTETIFGEDRQFTSAIEILTVVEPMLVDLDARLTACEATVKAGLR
jgi:hypothetical protein